MHDIGMDCHITTWYFAVVNDAGRVPTFHFDAAPIINIQSLKVVTCVCN